MLKVKLLPMSCLPIKKPTLNEELFARLFLECFVRRWTVPLRSRWRLGPRHAAGSGVGNTVANDGSGESHNGDISHKVTRGMHNRGRFTTTLALQV